MMTDWSTAGRCAWLRAAGASVCPPRHRWDRLLWSPGHFQTLLLVGFCFIPWQYLCCSVHGWEVRKSLDRPREVNQETNLQTERWESTQRNGATLKWENPGQKMGIWGESGTIWMVLRFWSWMPQTPHYISPSWWTPWGRIWEVLHLADWGDAEDEPGWFVGRPEAQLGGLMSPGTTQLLPGSPTAPPRSSSLHLCWKWIPPKKRQEIYFRFLVPWSPIESSPKRILKSSVP